LTAAGRRGPPLAATLRAIAGRHPEGWIFGLSAAAWWVWLTTPRLDPRLCVAIGRVLLGPSEAAALASSEAMAAMPWEWALMVAAMMLPLAAAPARWAAFNSPSPRRLAATAEVGLGFAAVWLAAGLVLVPSIVVASPLLGRQPIWTGVLALAAATAWRRTPMAAAATRACRRRPALAPRGWRADAGCLRFGAAQGGACVASCWILMLCPMAAPGGAWLAPFLMPLLLVERLPARPPPGWRLASLGFAWLGLALCSVLTLRR
jgi:predicted metal-binding membrane protein